MSANGTAGSELATVLALERELQTTACRGNRARLLEILAPDFVEIRASGRVWDLASILTLLASDSDIEDEITVVDLAGRVVGDGFALVHWVSEHRGRRARRTSLWRLDRVGWRQVYHQGTLLTD